MKILKFILIACILSSNAFSQSFNSIDPTGSNFVGTVHELRMVDPKIFYSQGIDFSDMSNPIGVLLKSQDAGQNWNVVVQRSVGNFEFLNEDTSFSIHYTYDNNTNIAYYSVDVSYDGWNTFDSISFSNVTEFYGPYIGNGNVYFSYRTDTSATYRSMNYGKSWQKICDTALSNIHFINDSIGYAWARIDDYTSVSVKSTNNGQSWSELNNASIAWENLDGAFYYFYAKSSGGDGFMKSTDEGKNYVAASNGLPDDFYCAQHDWDIKTWHFIDAQTGFAYDTKYGAGLYKTTDGGGHWEQLWNGALSLVNQMQCVYENGKLYMILSAYNNGTSTMHYGVFDSTDIWSSVPKSIDGSVQFRLYPNPVKDQLYIGYTGFIKLGTEGKLYNVSGQEVLHFTIQGAETRLSLKGLDKGLYILKIATETGEFVQKVVKE